MVRIPRRMLADRVLVAAVATGSTAVPQARLIGLFPSESQPNSYSPARYWATWPSKFIDADVHGPRIDVYGLIGTRDYADLHQSRSLVPPPTLPPRSSSAPRRPQRRSSATTLLARRGRRKGTPFAHPVLNWHVPVSVPCPG